MIIETCKLTGVALDWAVAQCEDIRVSICNSGTSSYLWLPPEHRLRGISVYRPSTEWSQGGPIIEREGFDLARIDATCWWAHEDANTKNMQYGSTLLIAAMRCYVVSKFCAEINIPDEIEIK